MARASASGQANAFMKLMEPDEKEKIKTGMRRHGCGTGLLPEMAKMDGGSTALYAYQGNAF